MEQNVSAEKRSDEFELTQSRVQRALATVVAVGFSAAFIFVAFPEIDLAISKLFFVEPTIFALTHSDDRLEIIGFIRQTGFFITRVTMIGLIVLLVLAFFLRYSPIRHYRKKLIYIFFCFAIAPGILVSVVLKENWGRARPSHIVEFGGKMQYTPPMMRADQCTGNCSFPSGEAAFAFCFLAFAMVARRRRFWVKVAMAYGAFFAFLRVSEGGHFTSDVTFSALISTLTCLLLYRYMFEHAYGYPTHAEWIDRRTAPAIGALKEFRNRLTAARATIDVDWPQQRLKENVATYEAANDPGNLSDRKPLATVGGSSEIVQLRPVRKN